MADPKRNPTCDNNSNDRRLLAEARHDEVERQMRRLIEHVAQLSIDLSVTRTDLRRLGLVVEGKVSEADLDPSFATVNEGIKEARVKPKLRARPS